MEDVFQALFRDLRTRMEKTLHKVQEDLKAIRTGRASIHLFDHVRVDYYGTPTPISQVATIRIPEPNLVVIQPWEPRMLALIEKAILTSDLGLSPVNDGKVVRVPIPPLTEERRREFAKQVWKIAEEGKTAIRMIRRDGNEHIRAMERDKKCSEDDARRARDQVQKLTDEYIDKIDQLAKAKEREVLES